MCGHCGCGETSKPEIIDLHQSILSDNDHMAAHNREHFEKSHITAINLVSSPGAGKTTLLEHTLKILNKDIPCAVIEGDQQTDLDAVRIAKTGVAVKQINTGHGCHLEAASIHDALHEMQLPSNSYLFIENVGNLVCPALFDLGEQRRVVLLSVTEGDDKPLKYPDMFAKSHCMVITKMDLLPYVDFDVDQCVSYAKRLQPDIEVITLSVKQLESLNPWFDYLR